MTFPLPIGMIREFAAKVERLFVVEELEPYIEDEIRILGLPVEGKAFFLSVGRTLPGRRGRRLCQGRRAAL